MADDDVKLGAAAGVLVILAADADHAIAVREPDFFRIARGVHAVHESDLGRVGVGVGKNIEIGDGCAGQGELSVQAFDAHFRRSRGIGSLRPLRDEIVLHARDGAIGEESFARERLHIGDVFGGEGRRHLDDDAALPREVHVERVLRIEHAPFRRLRCGDDIGGRGRVAFGRTGNGENGRCDLFRRGGFGRLTGAKRENRNAHQ